MTRRLAVLAGAWVCVAAGCVGPEDRKVLDNQTLALTLGVDTDGIPLIQHAEWRGKGQASGGPEPLLEGIPVRNALAAWLPSGVIPKAPLGTPSVPWRLTDDTVFHRAEATRPLGGGLRITWVIELAKRGSLFRTHVRLANEGKRRLRVEWFPAWTASWRLADNVEWVRGWEALSFRPVERPLAPGKTVAFRSRLHSSDRKGRAGMNPYWIVGGKGGRLCFGLAWCGGWEAKLAGEPGGFRFSVRLGPDETQLVLAPGEQITGPVVSVTPLRPAEEMAGRAEWMAQRAALAHDLFGGPEPSYPLSYNNWYTTRFGISADFLRRQVAAMDPYGFDFFIVDAGWYEKVGQWTPDRRKFKPGEFEAILRSVRDKDVQVGIWSCPQFVHASKDALPPEVDQPGCYEKFIDGHLLDLAGSGFTERLTKHVATLRQRYHAGWWKYDQLLFAAKTRAGVMKNVVAFQEALLAVRKANPDLFIENCQSGGRMINEFTVLATQSQWLRDGGGHGLEHARSNVAVALGAMAFVPPWAAGRWTNNFQKMDPNDDELTRFYCRSAMAGTWGIVSDLSKIGHRQRAGILKEVGHYRRLNALKPGYLYDIVLPADGVDVAGVTFYRQSRREAAVLLYRWNRKGPFDHQVKLAALQSGPQYKIEEADSGEVFTETAEQLHHQGVRVRFDPRRMSALLFLQAVE